LARIKTQERCVDIEKTGVDVWSSVSLTWTEGPRSKLLHDLSRLYRLHFVSPNY